MLAAKPQVVWRLPFGSEHVWQRLGFCFRLGVLGHSNVCSRHFAVDVQTVDGLVLRFLLASACWLLTSGAATRVGDVFAIAVSLQAWSVAQRPSHQLLLRLQRLQLRLQRLQLMLLRHSVSWGGEFVASPLAMPNRAADAPAAIGFAALCRLQPQLLASPGILEVYGRYGLSSRLEPGRHGPGRLFTSSRHPSRT